MLRAIIPALAILAGVHATAEARYACTAKRTPDGFVALREGPSARNKLIARMKRPELIQLLHPDKDEVVRSGDWLFVRWYAGTRRTADHIPTVDATKGRPGWVHGDLIDCFEE
jgi:hypothetical protein